MHTPASSSRGGTLLERSLRSVRREGVAHATWVVHDCNILYYTITCHGIIQHTILY